VREAWYPSARAIASNAPAAWEVCPRSSPAAAVTHTIVPERALHPEQAAAACWRGWQGLARGGARSCAGRRPSGAGQARAAWKHPRKQSSMHGISARCEPANVGTAARRPGPSDCGRSAALSPRCTAHAWSSLPGRRGWLSHAPQRGQGRGRGGGGGAATLICTPPMHVNRLVFPINCALHFEHTPSADRNSGSRRMRPALPVRADGLAGHSVLIQKRTHHHVSPRSGTKIGRARKRSSPLPHPRRRPSQSKPRVLL